MERWLTLPPLSPKILNVRFCLDTEKWLTLSPLTENFKFKIWPEHGKMTDHLPQKQNYHIFFGGLLHERPFTRNSNFLV